MIKRQDQLQVIQSKIYEIRGQKVMLDFDLAEMYGTETKRLKEAVRRNTKRFPCDFMFELTKEESGRNSLHAFRFYGAWRCPTFFCVGMQLELINQTLAELQTQKKLSDKPRNPIGFVKP